MDTDEWLERYVDTFVAVLRMFHHDVQMVESSNELDDYHAGGVNWMHPEWFAILLQRLYETVRSDPDLAQIKIVSGPVRGLNANGL